MKRLTRKNLVEDFVSKIEDLGFVLVCNNENQKFFHYKHGILGFHKYGIEITDMKDTITDSYHIKLSETKPLIQNNKMIATFGGELDSLYISPIVKGVTVEQDRERLNNLLVYIYNIDVIKQSIRKNKLKRINGRLGIKV